MLLARSWSTRRPALMLATAVTSLLERSASILQTITRITPLRCSLAARMLSYLSSKIFESVATQAGAEALTLRAVAIRHFRATRLTIRGPKRAGSTSFSGQRMLPRT